MCAVSVLASFSRKQKFLVSKKYYAVRSTGTIENEAAFSHPVNYFGWGGRGRPSHQSPPPLNVCVCVCAHTHIHTERFIYLRFFVSFLSESSFFYRKLPFWLFLVDRGTWQYVGRPRSDELWRRQHPQCPSPLASSSITHSAHSPPTGTRQKKTTEKDDECIVR